MCAGEPGGGDAVSFVGVDEGKFSIVNMNFGIGVAGLEEFEDFQRGGDARGAGGDGVNGDAAGGGAFTEGGFFGRERVRRRDDAR